MNELENIFQSIFTQEHLFKAWDYICIGAVPLLIISIIILGYYSVKHYMFCDEWNWNQREDSWERIYQVAFASSFILIIIFINYYFPVS